MNEIITHCGHEVWCVGNPAQHERFAVYFMNPNQNTEMVGRKSDGRAYTIWPQVIEQASQQSTGEIIQIKVI